MKPKDLHWPDWLKLREELFASSARFIKLVNTLKPEIVEQTIEKSEWSPKDVLAHIVGWDIEVVKKFKEFLLNPDADDNYDINAFNKISVISRKDHSWDEVMNEFNIAQAELSEITSKLKTENIGTEPRFKEWVEILIEHYDHHRLKLEKLLD